MALVGGRFEILSLAAEGGMGRVYRARDAQNGNVVALKLLRIIESDAVARFRRETEALTRLDHPGVVRHVAAGTTDDGLPYLVMDWIEGEALRKRIGRTGPLEPEQVVTLAGALAGALAHAHGRGIVHRDVKPSNVIVPGDEFARAVLVDFGLARTPDDDVTRTGMLVGTPIYMAPEQVRGHDVTAASDVFSLGCAMYECLSQTTPFAANGATAVLARVLFDEPVPIERIAPRTPEPLAALVGAMLHKTASERPSMNDVLRALDDLDSAPESITVARVARLSGDEVRVVSVIVAGVPATRDENATLRHAGEALLSFDLERLRGIAARFDGELMPLPSGAVVCVLTARGGEANDLAARAADCALELKSALPDAPVALATGRGQTQGGVPIGDAVDRAVAFAPYEGDAVQIDDVTAALLATRFEPEHAPSGIFLRRRTKRSEPVRTLLGKPTPFVGRDAELAALEATIAQSASESVARATLVTSPSGGGKSRLRSELVARCASRDHVAVWIAHGDSVGAGVPFGLLGQMIRREARIADGDAAVIARPKLLARVERVVAQEEALRVAMFLGEMLAVRFEDDDIQLRAARSDPHLMADQMQRAFVDFLEAECAVRPVVLVIEDLQWGDQPTVAAIDVALRLLEDRPLSVIAFARPDVADVFPGLWGERGIHSLPLAPLPKKAAARLARAVLPGVTTDKRLAGLVDKAAGNVFFLEELLRAEAEGRGGVAPATVVAMVQSRLDALESGARRVLRAASVLGEAFAGDGVRALLGDDARDAERWLDTLVRAEVLSARGRSREQIEYVFRHALVREGAYAMLTDADRALGHRLAAEWLERSGESTPLVVAAHYERAGDSARAATAYLRAAEQALESSDLAGAIEHAERGVTLGASGELRGALRCVQAHVHHWRGDTEAMDAAAAEAIGLLRQEDARWADALTMLAVAKQRLGDTEDLASIAEDLSTALGRRSGDRAALARAGGRIASALFFAGKQEAGATMLDLAERAARDGGADVEARIQQARAPHARQAGRPAAALLHAEAAERAFRAAGDLRNACSMTGVRGFALSELGAYDEAEVVLEDALATAERLGLKTVAATARSNLGMVFSRLGRAADAEATVRVATAAFEASDVRHEGGSRAYLAMILRDAGELADAERQARRSLELLAGALALRPLACAVLATILLAGGRSREALDIARDAMRWLESGGNAEEGDALIRLALARSLFATGAVDEARTRIADARDRLRKRAATIDRADLRKTFLENVPEHAMTFELATAWRA